MNRRSFIKSTLAGIAGLALGMALFTSVRAGSKNVPLNFKKINRSEREWKKILSPEEYKILRKEGTERAYSSPLLNNKNPGIYACAACDLELFTSEMKYDSRTGWPSFYTSIPGRLATKKDFKLFFPRTEYHCARCEGHQGHIFNDGPPPTRKRWCNNGIALKFIPSSSNS